jgi:hypothetical protein
MIRVRARRTRDVQRLTLGSKLFACQVHCFGEQHALRRRNRAHAKIDIEVRFQARGLTPQLIEERRTDIACAQDADR